MESDHEGKAPPPPYDIRKNPCRGVRVPPLPRHVHHDFRRFCDGLRAHAQSHLSTITLARSSHENAWTRGELAYWRSCLKYINTLEYLGTTNGKHR
jgi:hypothetical protein